MLFKHTIFFPFSFAALSVGKSMLARIPIMPMTTSNSIRVNAASVEARRGGEGVEKSAVMVVRATG